MIKVRKREEGPAVLRDSGATSTAALCRAYDRGERHFEFDRGIYAHSSVKSALVDDQHAKCCFCESKVTAVAYGDVEHFRPKGGYRQEPGDSLISPGYYWLAYEWSNLFLSCQICNQRYKRNLFPLVDPAARAKNHHHSLAAEHPLLVAPDGQPEEHIAFDEEVAVGTTDAGRVSVTTLDLNRYELTEARLALLKPMRMMETAIQTSHLPLNLRQQMYELLMEARAPGSPFAGMLRARPLPEAPV
ncbi:MAG: hypothetical protein VX899_09125 [Myxococcota bacterium]|nr:hypothetical protein [Myxococcota bacterium]